MKKLTFAIVGALFASIIAVAQMSIEFSHTPIGLADKADERSSMKQEWSRTRVMNDFASARDNRHAVRQAEEVESIDIYGFVEYNVTDEAHRGLVKFNTTSAG